MLTSYYAEGYIEFCDGDCIETLEQFIEDLFQKEPKGSFFDIKNFLCYNICRKNKRRLAHLEV